ncbi:MAG TPA: amidase [Amycolatopsis sp.]|nr:amidase [Amycolatopsis sp.]
MATIETTSVALRRREVSSVELVRAALERADAVDGRLGAYLSRFDETALAAAARADADFAAGVDRGPLQGIPVGIKDNMFVTDGPTTAQSLVRDPAWDTSPDATAVARLKAAGAVVMGKLTLSEYAIGPSDVDAPFPRPRNPWHLGYWPGGSSSGTGVAISGGLVFAGLGSDTAGSVRMPAAACGVSGLKPTYGRVPVSGTIPLAVSLDHVGPMGRSVWDCAAMLRVIAGHDPADDTSLRAPVPDYLADLTGPLDGVRIGVADLDDATDPEVAAAFEDMLGVLRSLGLSTAGVTLPCYEATIAAAKIILAAEAFAFHQRNLGLRWRDYSRATRIRLGTGAFASPPEVADARRQREAARDGLEGLFRTVDVVVSPTMAVPAPRYGPDEQLDRALIGTAARAVRYWSCAGYPALAIPMGFSADGLPLSVQLVAAPLRESLLFRVGAAVQRATDWHLREPPLTEAGTTGNAVVTEVLAKAGIDPGEDLDAMAKAYQAHCGDVTALRAGAGEEGDRC